MLYYLLHIWKNYFLIKVSVKFHTNFYYSTYRNYIIILNILHAHLSCETMKPLMIGIIFIHIQESRLLSFRKRSLDQICTFKMWATWPWTKLATTCLCFPLVKGASIALSDWILIGIKVVNILPLLIYIQVLHRVSDI